MAKVNVVIPMAGKGKRFLDAGYTVPKPMIPINGKPMVEYVIECMKFPEAHFVFICQKEHCLNNHLDKVLKALVPDCDIIMIDRMTEGSICTVLLASHLFSDDNEVIIKDCDQIIDWVPENFLNYARRNNSDGGIITINTTDPGYSFAKVNGISITETAEKIVISNHGSVGIYYFRRGKELIKYANQMIAKNIRTNNEFYVCPVYNEYIQDGKLIVNYPIAQMYQLGTPEDFKKNKDVMLKLFIK